MHNGVDLKSIQKRVGHKDIETTLKIYAKIREKKAKEELTRKLNDMLPMKKYKPEDKSKK